MTDDEITEALRRKVAEQASDLVNKVKLSPATVATMYFEIATALALNQSSVKDVAGAFRHHWGRAATARHAFSSRGTMKMTAMILAYGTLAYALWMALPW